MKKTITLIGAIAGLLLPFVSSAQTRVACVGDSTTWGFGLANQSTESYPARLQARLGSGYTVRNFGVNGACMAKNDSASYWNTTTFTDAKNFDPQIVIILLGTNDGDPPRWNNVKNEFYNDYVAMVNAFRASGHNPRIYAGYPLPCFTSVKAPQDTTIKTQVIPLIKQAVSSQGLTGIDFNTTMQVSYFLQSDGIHPNPVGAQRMADIAFSALFPSGPVANGTYKIIARHSGSALDAVGSANGANVDQWGYNGGNNQRWLVTGLGNSQYSIIGIASGLAVDVSGASTGDGANVLLWPYGGASNQKWTVQATSGGYNSVLAVHSAKALDVTSLATTNGANVEQWTYTGGNNQQWIFQAP